MRNRNDSEGNCEVVEELRATYSERKREDEKTGTADAKTMKISVKNRVDSYQKGEILGF